MNKIRQPLLHHRRKGETGFTLIELLVVIAVLAILAAIVIFNVVGVANRGKSNACQTDVQSVQTAVDAYLNDNPSTTNASNPFGLSGTTHSLAITSGWSGWGALKPAYIHSVPNFGGTNNECVNTAATVAQANGADFAQGLTITGN
jgi:prepilin-type N-terminal cleavage/methylation domain-containing protein